MPFVETHIQPQAVERQVAPQGVGGGPGDGFPHVHGHQGYGLPHHGDPYEQGGRPEQSIEILRQNGRFAGSRFNSRGDVCRIDEVGHNLGIGQLQADRHNQQQGQPQHRLFLGFQVAGQQIPVGFDGQVELLQHGLLPTKKAPRTCGA